MNSRKEKSMEGELVHFDIPADDLERASEFYRAIFGWKIEPVGGFEGYLEIKPGGREEATGGGITKRFMPEQRPVNYFEVSSIDEANRRVRDGGGQVIVEKMTVPGFGYLSLCADTEDNAFGMWLEDPGAA